MIKNDVVSNNALIKTFDKQLLTIHNSTIKLWETETSSFFDIKESCSFIPDKGNVLGHFKDGIIFNGKLVLTEGGFIKDSHIHIINIKEEKPLKIKTIRLYGYLATIKLKPKDSECVFLVFPY